MPTKECKSCKQEIKQQAEKCHHCGTSQGKPRIVEKISLYVGTAIAVVSLAIMGYESAKKLLDSEKANLVVNVTDIDTDAFNIAVSNIGSKPAIIYDLTIKYPPSTNCADGKIWTMHRVDFADRVVEAGKTYSVSSKVTGLYKAFAGFDPHALSDKKFSKQLEKFKVCSTKLSYLDFDGSHNTVNVDFHCGPQGECPDSPDNRVN
ncbi:hypothetical protein [Cellvibrio sp. BR]|uniref:hypothetical protein n=1 Tax=Cellvibrio sp. BR TaxID=1134474 RepID=UPI00058E38F5|nr:hypothetical protein [Cellvibrio sp. BR]